MTEQNYLGGTTNEEQGPRAKGSDVRSSDSHNTAFSEVSTLLYKAGKILRNVAPKFFPIYSRFSPRWESHFQNSALPSPKNVLAPFTSKFPPPDPLVHMPHLFGDRRITTKDTDFGLEVP